MPETIVDDFTTTKCPICKGDMKYKMFVGAGNVQGYECVWCSLIVGNETLQKLREISWK